MFGISNQENTLDGIERSSRQLWHSVHSRSSTLRVALKDEALVRACSQRALDLSDDICGTGAGVLIGTCWIDGVVLFATGDLAHDVGVHCAEASRGALGFAGAASVDDGWSYRSVNASDWKAMRRGLTITGTSSTLLDCCRRSSES